MIAQSLVPDTPLRSQPLNHVDGYLEIGQKAGASDVHMAVNAPPIWRLHGTLQPIWPDAPLLTSEQTAALAENFVPDVYKTELNARGDSDFAYANEFARYRTSVVRQRLGIEIVFRVINSKVRTMDELGLPEQLKDRKSTRLNSSHLGISYAVFCLKKKSRRWNGSVERGYSPHTDPHPCIRRG